MRRLRGATKIRRSAREVKVKVGVVGCGHLGALHARIYGELPGVELVGVHDSDPAAAARCAERLGCRVWPTLGALAEAAEALSVCAPTPAHRAVALPALAAG
ncbi:gfo/Idh/MocA family oxidoreductase, partial [bacterium]|nr:gfo/Idh/MocA family oxidoreductase [bacterium]